MAPGTKFRRGYPVAILVGFDQQSASIWRVYSQAVKMETTIRLVGVRSDPKTVYNFHEAIVNSLRGTLKEGVRSIIVVAPSKTSYSQEFHQHVNEHHVWLNQGPNKITFTEIVGSAVTRSDLSALVKNPGFRKTLQAATSEETENLLAMLDKRINSQEKDDMVLYSLNDVEDTIMRLDERKINLEFLLLTDEFLAKAHQKWRINRLMQIATNKKIKNRVIESDTPAGKRLTQLGGIVLIAKRL